MSHLASVLVSLGVMGAVVFAVVWLVLCAVSAVLTAFVGE